jgi:hypothetical protein
MGYYDGRKVPLTVFERLQLLAADDPENYCGEANCKCALPVIEEYERTGTLPEYHMPELPDYTTVQLIERYDDEGPWR